MSFVDIIAGCDTKPAESAGDRLIVDFFGGDIAVFR